MENILYIVLENNLCLKKEEYKQAVRDKKCLVCVYVDCHPLVSPCDECVSLGVNKGESLFKTSPIIID